MASRADGTGEKLKAWQSRIEAAQHKQRPGDILVLADEAPNPARKFEALCQAADALLRMEHPRYALSVIRQARKLDPDDVNARRREETASERASKQAAAQASEPQHVVLFSGHMIDNPDVRGPGKEKAERFPARKVPAATARIRAELDQLGAGAGDIGLCGGASGGDLLFAEACLERGMRMEVRLAREEDEFLAESVTFADPDGRWLKSFRRVTQHPATL